jgi:hypothetical protein
MTNDVCKYGIPICLVQSFRFYNADNQLLVFDIFIEIFKRTERFDQIGLIQFAIDLAISEINESEDCSQAVKLLATISAHPRLSRTAQMDDEIRTRLQQVFFKVFKTGDDRCYSDSLRGLYSVCYFQRALLDAQVFEIAKDVIETSQDYRNVYVALFLVK